MRMRNFVTVLTLTVLVSVAHQCLSQDDRLEPGDRRVSFPDPGLLTPTPDPAPAPNTPVANPVSDLRSQYLELVRTQSELMDDNTLTSEIARAEKTITELRAEQKLDAARELLTSISKEYPDSEAAKTAARMLQAEAATPIRERNGDPENWTPPVRKEPSADFRRTFDRPDDSLDFSPSSR